MLHATDRAIARFARANHGVITRGAALEAGASAGFIHRRVESGAWCSVGRGVYVVDTSPDTWLRDVAIGVLSVTDGAARGRTAAILHGLNGFARRSPPEVITHHTASGRNDLADVMRSEKFPVMRKTEVEGIVTIDPIETVFNLAWKTSSSPFSRRLDEVLVRNLGTIGDLGEVYDRYEGARLKGIRKLRPLVLERIGGGYLPNESELEFLLDELLQHPAIPEAYRQHRPDWLPGGARVDRWIPRWRMVIEADGRGWHTKSSDFERDRERDNAAAAAGVIVLRFTYTMLRNALAECRRQVIDAGALR